MSEPNQQYHQALSANRKLLAENARLRAEVDNLRKNAEINTPQSTHEIARLKAEVEELKSQPDPLTAYLYAAELGKEDRKKLKAYIGRIIKAGDAMASSLQFEETLNDSDRIPQSVQDWLSAKRVD